MAIYYDGYDWDCCGFPGEFVHGDDVYVPDYMCDERWKTIRAFPDYWISTWGRVYSSQSDRFLYGTPLEHGHIDVSFRANGRRYHRYMHRLVAEAFIPNPYELPIVRHLDDDPSNNHVDNLAWGTQLDNMGDCIRSGRFRYFTREDIERANAARRTPIIAVDIDTGAKYVFVSQQEASRVLGIPQPSISDSVRRRKRPVNGYIFYYQNEYGV